MVPITGRCSLGNPLADHTVLLWLINPTRNPVTLYCGAAIGTFTKTYDDVQMLSLHNNHQDSPVRPTSAENVPVDLTNTDLTEEQQPPKRVS